MKATRQGDGWLGGFGRKLIYMLCQFPVAGGHA